MVFSGTLDLATRLGSYGVIICWWLFGLTFWLRKRPPKVKEAKRDWVSLLGLALQALAYLLVWFDPLRRRLLPLHTVDSPALRWAIAGLAIVIALGSVALVNSAARHLGKQWALTARVVEGHNLIQNGPYRLVRNPIYTGMLCMLLATGLVGEQWNALAIAIVIFLAGTYIRVQSEERLLQEAFGSEFEAYKRKVPALIPGIY